MLILIPKPFPLDHTLHFKAQLIEELLLPTHISQLLLHT